MQNGTAQADITTRTCLSSQEAQEKGLLGAGECRGKYWTGVAGEDPLILCKNWHKAKTHPHTAGVWGRPKAAEQGL